MPDANSISAVRELIVSVGIPTTITLALIYFVLRPVALRLTGAGEGYLLSMSQAYQKLCDTTDLLQEHVSQAHVKLDRLDGNVSQAHSKLDQLLGRKP